MGCINSNRVATVKRRCARICHSRCVRCHEIRLCAVLSGIDNIIATPRNEATEATTEHHQRNGADNCSNEVPNCHLGLHVRGGNRSMARSRTTALPSERMSAHSAVLCFCLERSLRSPDEYSFDDGDCRYPGVRHGYSQQSNPAHTGPELTAPGFRPAPWTFLRRPG
jgi:hypothetical protein